MTFGLEKAREVAAFMQSHCHYGGDRFAEALAEIERLRADNAGLSKAVIDIQGERDLAQAEFRAYHKAWEEQAARTKELEEALVEELAKDLAYDDGSLWTRCMQDDYREMARQQLQEEGKIGSNDHIVEPGKMVWQITGERKDALSIVLQYISYDAHDDIDICGHAAVLRAMLEAEQE